MKLAILTTQTTHHAYFIQELIKVFPDITTVIETSTVKPTFETFHPFEKVREDFEKENVLNGKEVFIRDLISSKEFETINDADAIKHLKQLKADVVLDFGTRKLSPNFLKNVPGRIINLHGGDPEKYRGLDSHLWAIYHRDFDSLIVTLHEVNEVLDDGKIISQERIKLTPGMKIYELRLRNTEICLRMSIAVLKEFQATKILHSIQQRDKGRYYSFMPAVLKNICVGHFDKHIESHYGLLATTIRR